MALLVALVLAGGVAMLMVAGSSQAQTGQRLGVQNQRARAAADAAAAMAVRELASNTDHDGDGGVGSISSDGNTGNDPTLNQGTRLWATRTDSGGVVTITAFGANADASASVQMAATVTTGGGAPDLFMSRETSPVVRRSQFSTTTNTWGTPSTVGTCPIATVWVAAARVGSSTALLASDSDKILRYGVAGSGGTATFSNICSNLGSSNHRPFDVAAEGASGEGLIVYHDSSSVTMRSRTIVSGTVSSATNMGFTNNDVYWVRLIALGSASNEIMALFLDEQNDLVAIRWTGSAWTGMTTLYDNLRSTNSEGFAAALEQTSGRLMVAYSDAQDNRVGYRIFTPGSGWSSNVWVNGFDSKVVWLRLVSLPSSNQIKLAATNEVGRLRTSLWNGTSWSSPTQLTDNVGSDNCRRFDIHVSPDGSDVMVMYAKAGGTLFYRLWTGSAWSNEATAFTLSSGNAEFVLARPGPSGGMLVGAVGDSNGGVNAWSWSGTAFNTTSRVATTGSSFSTAEWFAITSGGSGTNSVSISGVTGVAP